MREPDTGPRPRGRCQGRGRRAWLVAAAVGAALACRERTERVAEAPAATEPAGAEGADFTMADLVAATRLDAALQRVLALSAEYKAALTFDRGPRLPEHTDRIASRLDQAVPALDAALAAVRDPRDRARAAPLVSTARRWPELLRAARAELLASPHPATRASDALAAADDELARSLDAYRTFRASWRIVDSPAELEPVLAFLRARRELEAEERELGRRLGGDGGVAEDVAAARSRIDGLAERVRAAAEQVDEARRPAAKRLADAEVQALRALAALGAPGGLDEQRGRDALAYQVAKVAALEAVAEYVALSAPAGSGPR